MRTRLFNLISCISFRFLLIYSCIFLFSCHNQNGNYKEDASDSVDILLSQLNNLNKKIGEDNNLSDFFVNDTLDYEVLKKSILHKELTVKKSTSLLYDINEPILSENLQENQITFRITRHGPFDTIVIVRFYRIDYFNDSSITLTSKMARQYNNDSLILIHETKLEVDIKDWNIINSKIRQSYFWDLTRRTEDAGCDGTTIIIEGAHNNFGMRRLRIPQYQKVERWNPVGNDFESISCFITKLSGEKRGRFKLPCE